jgi:hypothetical protein
VAWTYDPTLPTPRDVLRFEIGDTIATRPLMQDEELDALLAVNDDNVTIVAWKASEHLAGYFGGKADKTVGRLSISYGRQSDYYTSLSRRLRRRALTGSPLAGGMGPTTLAPKRDDYFNVPHNVVPNPSQPPSEI